MVDWFLAIHDGEADSLKSYIEIYCIEERRLPEKVLPIAHDPGGNLICMVCKNENVGEIYFWDHEKEFAKKDVNDYANMYFIAPTLANFIDQLFE